MAKDPLYTETTVSRPQGCHWCPMLTVRRGDRFAEKLNDAEATQVTTMTTRLATLATVGAVFRENRGRHAGCFGGPQAWSSAAPTPPRYSRSRFSAVVVARGPAELGGGRESRQPRPERSTKPKPRHGVDEIGNLVETSIVRDVGIVLVELRMVEKARIKVDDGAAGTCRRPT
jgi:hypothetical protein